MIQIYEPIDTTIRLLGEQNVNSNKIYRPLNYLLKYNVAEGLLIYNCMTRELILLAQDEASLIDGDIDITNPTIQSLIKKWFIIPIDTNEATIAKQIRTFLTSCFYSYNKPLTKYTILTTTECNARCFYCYEMGRRHIRMTDKIANDTAEYIIRKCEGNPVKLRWFGGEPLYNKKAIDIICNKLCEANIKYSSSMVSNGYLFDYETILQAKKLWNLENVQITLDGTEEIYNRCKNFIYTDTNPYQIVMQNIENLLKNEIIVIVRMNMDDHNATDLYKLTDILQEKFGNYKKFFAYAHLLFEDSGEKQINRSDVERHLITQQFLDFEEYMRFKIPRKPKGVKNLLQYHQCMADDPASTSVMPDGHLGKCEHFSDTDFWGSIYSEDINQSAIDEFRRFKDLGEKCDKCVLRPMCYELVRCVQTVERCDEYDLKMYLAHIELAIMSTYEDWKKNQ